MAISPAFPACACGLYDASPLAGETMLMPVMPYPPYRAAVAPEWIDYNGHMNVAYYVLAFDRATDLLLDHLGLGEAYRRATNRSLFVLEAHVTYARELRAGDRFEIETRLIDADRKL